MSKGGNTVGAAVPDAKTDTRHCKSDAGANRPIDYLRGRDGGYAPRSRGLPPASGSFLGAAGFSEARGFRTMSGTRFALRLHLFSSLYIERAARLPEHAAHMQRDRAGYTRLVPPALGFARCSWILRAGCGRLAPSHIAHPRGWYSAMEPAFLVAPSQIAHLGRGGLRNGLLHSRAQSWQCSSLQNFLHLAAQFSLPMSCYSSAERLFLFLSQFHFLFSCTTPAAARNATTCTASSPANWSKPAARPAVDQRAAHIVLRRVFHAIATSSR